LRHDRFDGKVAATTDTEDVSVEDPEMGKDCALDPGSENSGPRIRAIFDLVVLSKKGIVINRLWTCGRNNCMDRSQPKRNELDFRGSIPAFKE